MKTDHALSAKTLTAFRRRLRFLRTLAGMTQAVLAEKASISLEHLNKIERGAAAPSFHVIASLANALHTDAANLFLFDQEPVTPGDPKPAENLDWTSFLSSASGIIFVPEHDEVFMSPSLLQLIGSDKEPKPSLNTFLTAVHDRDRERVAATCSSFITAKAITRAEPFRLLSAQGEYRFIVGVCEHIPQSVCNKVAFLWILVDITEQLRLEYILRSAQNDLDVRVRERTGKLEGAVEDMQKTISTYETEYGRNCAADSLRNAYKDATDEEGVIVFRDHKPIFANERFLAMFGLHKEDVIGNADLSFLAADESSQRAIRTAVLAERLEPYGVTAKRSSGEKFPALVLPKLVQSSEGTLRVSVVRELDSPLDCCAHVRKALAKAEAANQAKSDFLASMSHEIRTPLNAMISLLQLLDTMELGTDYDEYVGRALHAGRSLLHVITDIIDLSRIENGKISIRSAPFRPRELAHAVVLQHQEAARRKGLKLTWSMDENTPDCVIADPDRITQILTNLVSNAVKYTHRGSVSLELCSLKHALKERRMLLFCIRDTGVGIADDKLEQIFDPYFQVQRSDGVLQGQRSFGLGLAIVKHLVRAMNGSLNVESEPGKGTTMTVTLPVVLFDSRELEEPETQELSTPAMRLLLVEDEPLNRLLCERLLERLGHKVQTAASGFEALKLLASSDGDTPFDAVLLDICMDGMDGAETARRIRQCGKPHARLPIAAVTARAMKDDREKLLAQGFDGYLAKPVYARPLNDLLGQLWRLGQERRGK